MVKQIPLTQGKHALIDDEDYEKISGFSWYTHQTNRNLYACSCINGKLTKMQNFLMGKKKNMFWDHINRNGLDNRRCNLRLATKTENLRNSRKRKNASSKYKGVSFYKRDGVWQANIRVNKKLFYLGRFEKEIDAAKAYNDAAEQYFGEYANLNKLHRKG